MHVRKFVTLLYFASPIYTNRLPGPHATARDCFYTQLRLILFIYWSLPLLFDNLPSLHDNAQFQCMHVWIQWLHVRMAEPWSVSPVCMHVCMHRCTWVQTTLTGCKALTCMYSLYITLSNRFYAALACLYSIYTTHWFAVSSLWTKLYIQTAPTKEP